MFHRIRIHSFKTNNFCIIKFITPVTVLHHYTNTLSR
jgi:hypothetical protein